MTADTNNERADYPSLYERTGDITDINTLLVPRAFLAANAPAATTQVHELLARWEKRALDALPADAMLINRHIRELREVAPPAPTEQWHDIETAPKDGIWQDGNNHYAEYILVWYPGALRPMRARWWFRDDSEACNFLADGGYAVFPTMYQPLPAPPQGAAKKDES